MNVTYNLIRRISLLVLLYNNLKSTIIFFQMNTSKYTLLWWTHRMPRGQVLSNVHPCLRETEKSSTAISDCSTQQEHALEEAIFSLKLLLTSEEFPTGLTQVVWEYGEIYTILYHVTCARIKNCRPETVSRAIFSLLRSGTINALKQLLF